MAEAFIARVTSPKVAATAERVESTAALPEAVARYLRERDLPKAIALQPLALLRSLDWSGFEVRASVASDEVAAIGMARWGIAETGSLVFHSGADTAVLANFLFRCITSCCSQGRSPAYLEDYATLVAGQPMPRNVNLITGASGTTDIEGSLGAGRPWPEVHACRSRRRLARAVAVGCALVSHSMDKCSRRPGVDCRGPDPHVAGRRSTRASTRRASANLAPLMFYRACWLKSLHQCQIALIPVPHPP